MNIYMTIKSDGTGAVFCCHPDHVKDIKILDDFREAKFFLLGRADVSVPPGTVASVSEVQRIFYQNVETL